MARTKDAHRTPTVQFEFQQMRFLLQNTQGLLALLETASNICLLADLSPTHLPGARTSFVLLGLLGWRHASDRIVLHTVFVLHLCVDNVHIKLVESWDLSKGSHGVAATREKHHYSFTVIPVPRVNAGRVAHCCSSCQARSAVQQTKIYSTLK